MNANGYQDLANAIVEKAASDYRRALCSYHKDHDKGSESEIIRIEAFFRSEAYEIYTTINGDYLIRELRKECARHKYDIDAIENSIGRCRD